MSREEFDVKIKQAHGIAQEKNRGQITLAILTMVFHPLSLDQILDDYVHYRGLDEDLLCIPNAILSLWATMRQTQALVEHTEALRLHTQALYAPR